MYISVDQLEKSEKRYVSVKDGPARDRISDLSQEAFISEVPPEIIEGNMYGPEKNLAKRREMLASMRQEPLEFAYERAIGKNDSVYSNFVELIRDAKQKVGRIAVKNGNKNIGYATGFMVAENLLLTNWHVFKDINEVAESEVQFFHELDTNGNPVQAVSFKLNSKVFYHSNKDLDYCFVAVDSTDTSGKARLSDIGYIYLDPGLGKLGSEEEEALNIIHHPDGDYKQLSIRENLFVKITPTSIWYQTDTAPGSSGSPVFNDQWQVVALHHMGVGKKNEAGEYVDKNGKPIAKVNGKVDVSKVVWEANEGIRISVILKDLFNKYGEEKIVSGLKVKPETRSIHREEITETNKTISSTQIIKPSDMETTNNPDQVNISFPATLLEKNGSININITQGGMPSIQAGKTSAPKMAEESLFEEIKKLEETADFSSCKGYQEKFLGTNASVALPEPMKEIKKFIAKVANTDSVVLKYYNYSVIFHSVRMMPALSAINVDGDPAKRLDDSPRKDVWLRDNRLSFDIQLNDEYYKRSGFDRGHMSRREDANWGATAEEAKRNADYTCMHTNACPQVGRINQSGKKGLWGILEKVVLEGGAELEKGKTSKISVFNGPIFKESDPVFRGIQVPMDFYKIVLWLTDKGKLKATAFKLTQEGLVDDIDFEQLDLDQNAQFKEYQCSIKWLQEQTKINFSHLFEYDTYEGKDMELSSEQDVLTHMKKHKKS